MVPTLGAQIEARYGLFSGGAKFSFAENGAVNTTPVLTPLSSSICGSESPTSRSMRRVRSWGRSCRAPLWK